MANYAVLFLWAGTPREETLADLGTFYWRFVLFMVYQSGYDLC